MKDTGLLPCPFCGSSASVDRDESSDYEQHWTWFIHCANPECCGRSDDHIDKTNAIKQWNNRSGSSPDMERLQFAFLSWLPMYERHITGRWRELSIVECDTLSRVQWDEVIKLFETYKGD